MNSLQVPDNWQKSLGLVALGVTPKQAFGSTEQDVNSNGVLKWRLRVDSDLVGTFEVTIASATAPQMAKYRPVAFEGLMLGGSSRGLWWAAAGVRAVAE